VDQHLPEANRATADRRLTSRGLLGDCDAHKMVMRAIRDIRSTARAHKTPFTVVLIMRTAGEISPACRKEL
jgi:hypothetical protein